MSNPAKRPKNIQVRLTSEEHNAFNRAAARAGKAPSTWLRDLGLASILGHENTEQMRDKDDAALIEEVVKASDVPGRSDPVLWENSGHGGEAPHHTPMPYEIEIKSSLSDFKTINHVPLSTQSAQDRIYEIILRRDGKAKADAWLSQRRKPVAPVIVEPEIPSQLRPFYNSLLEREGKASADFWLVNQLGGKKINI